jgi:hypothetical protein
MPCQVSRHVIVSATGWIELNLKLLDRFSKQYVAIPEVFKVKQGVNLKASSQYYELRREFQEDMGFIAMDLLASSWLRLYTVFLHSKNDQRKEHAGLSSIQMI